MLQNLKMKLKYYKFPQFVLLTIVVLMCTYISIKYIGPKYISNRYYIFHLDEICRWSLLLLSCVAVYFYYNYIKKIKYKVETHGRSYAKDKQKYGKSLSDSDRKDFYKKAEDNRIRVNPKASGDWTKCHGIILGNINGHIFERGAGDIGNIITAGKPGCGKSTNLICTATVYDGALVVNDIKGDIYNGVSKCLKVLGLKRRRKVFNISNPNKSYHYNPLRGVDQMNEDELDELLEDIACIIIPASASSEGEYFVNTARDYFMGISHYTLHKNITASFPDIVNAVFEDNGIKWIEKIMECDCEAAKDYLAGKYGENERNLCGGYSKLRSQLKPFKRDAIQKLLINDGNCITGEDLNDGIDIYLRMSKKEMARNSALVTIIIQDFLNSMLERPDNTEGKKNTNTLFLLDEFSQLRRIGSLSPDDPQISISDAMATLRSKSCTLLLCMQSISQIDKVYTANVRKEIFDTCEYFLIYSVQDPETRKYFSDLIGQQEVLNVSSSSPDAKYSSTSKSTTRSREYLIQPEEFGRLSERNKVAIYSNGRYAIADKVQYFNADPRLMRK